MEGACQKEGTAVGVELEVEEGGKRDCCCAGTNATGVWRRKVIGGYPVPCRSAHCTLEKQPCATSPILASTVGRDATPARG